ncbi:RING finger protein [Teratosphaeria destructans]|uniref:RING finger protein n=1 Tax=Teratosphaeria destructans TaxID=418781 RepID=A0A9W7SHL0_9PEZI|nr:RING finger protein [Teratosphaeria destructans]
MASGQVPGRVRQPQVIDLISDDSDDDPGSHLVRSPPPRSNNVMMDPDGDFNGIPEGFFDEPNGLFTGFTPPEDRLQSPMAPAMASRRSSQLRAELRGEYIMVDGEQVFIPDEDDELMQAPADMTSDNAGASGEFSARDLSLDLTVDVCLQRVLEIFPDVSHEHVVRLYDEIDPQTTTATLTSQARLDNVIEKLVTSNGGYPKQDRGKKRKREDSVEVNDFKRWESEHRDIFPTYLKAPMRAMLKAEFPEIPQQYVNNTLDHHKYFYKAYIALAKDKDDGDDNPMHRRFGRGRVRQSANAGVIAQNSTWPDLVAELDAARRKVQIIRAQKAAEDAKKAAEQENLQQAMERGETAECQACFEDLPMNRQVHCDGDTPHFTCYDCITTYIKTQVGDSRCNVLCTAGCQAAYPPNQLNQLQDKQLLAKLAELEQEKAIRDAGLEDLEECPFCDYKAILPPIEEDFEFRCANPECEKVSCRRCKSISHIPISCEQHAKDNKINTRHKIEEAMTAALIRTCNNCKKAFIKEYGCNKMTCPSCAHTQCYICSKSLTDYNHFDQAPGRATGGGERTQKCPLYDNVEERHEREVREAEEAARAQAVAENPDVTADDLEIKVSNSVKRSTAARIAAGGHPGNPGMPNLGFGLLPGRPPGFHAGPLPDDMLQAFMERAGLDDHLENHRRQRRMLAAHRAGQAARILELRQRAQLPPPQPAGFAGRMAGYIPVFGMPGHQAPQDPAAPVPPPHVADLDDPLGPDPFAGLFQQPPPLNPPPPEQHNPHEARIVANAARNAARNAAAEQARLRREHAEATLRRLRNQGALFPHDALAAGPHLQELRHRPQELLGQIDPQDEVNRRGRYRRRQHG